MAFTHIQAIYRRGSHRVGFGVVELSRDLEVTTLKVQMNQSCAAFSAVIKSKML